MATVKFSEKLSKEVRNKIERMCGDELNRHPVDTTVAIHYDDPRILAFALGEHTNLWGTIPTNWLVQKNRVMLRFTDVPADDGTLQHFTCYVSPFSGHFLFPCNSDYTPEIRLMGSVGPWVEFAHLPNVLAAKRDITNKWRVVSDQVCRFFNSFPSVNSAVKHTPSMMMYLPQDAIDRLNEKVERTKPTTPTLNVDVDSLVGAAVGYRLGV